MLASSQPALLGLATIEEEEEEEGGEKDEDREDEQQGAFSILIFFLAEPVKPIGVTLPVCLRAGEE